MSCATYVNLRYTIYMLKTKRKYKWYDEMLITT